VVAGLEVAERPQFSLFEDAIARRNGMAVRVFKGFAKKSGQRLLHTKRDGVF